MVSGGEVPTDVFLMVVNPQTRQVDFVCMANGTVDDNPQLKQYLIVRRETEITPENPGVNHGVFPEMQGPIDETLDLETTGESAFEHPPDEP